VSLREARPRNIWLVVLWMFVGSLGLIWAVGMLIIWLHPPTAYEKCIVNKTAATLRECG
jgi:hypothetical protein